MSKTANRPSVVLQGIVLTKRDSLDEVDPFTALTLMGDSNLEVLFVEEDRESLLEINPERFAVITRVMGTKITTHAELESLLLPPKPVKKGRKPTAKKPKATKTKED
jgi:hypothetical protein